MQQEFLSWSDVEALLEHLLPQFYGSFDAALMIARGGIVPGGLIAERLGLTNLLTATIAFPANRDRRFGAPLADLSVGRLETPTETEAHWGLPTFVQFPPDTALHGRRTLVINHIWNHGRAVVAAAGRVAAAGGIPETCVLHFKPGNSLFPQRKPDYFAAVTDRYIIYPWEAAQRLEPYRPMPELR